MADELRLTDEQKVALRTLCDDFMGEDREVRDRQLRQYKLLKYYWDGITQLYWQSVAHDWRIYGIDGNRETGDQDYYDKPINVFRAYLESIIAALSVSIPPINCIPDDAENPDDLATAKAGEQISKLIYRHNDVILLWIHALFIYCTEGLIYGYTDTDYDESYGTYEENEYEEEEIQAIICPTCGVNQPDDALANNVADSYNPDDSDVPLVDVQQEVGPICVNCARILDPGLQKSTLKIPRFVGKSKKPKGRQCIKAYGGLFVKTAVYAKTQKESPYLIFMEDIHYSRALAECEEIRDVFYRNSNKFTRNITGSYGTDPYEQWARIGTQYRGAYPTNTICRKQVWLRPETFEMVTDDKVRKELKKLFPDGCKVKFYDDILVEGCNESLDDHWTFSRNPQSDYTQFDPLGVCLVPVQDVTNDMFSLILQTIEHGIPQTFFDPAILDAEEYRNREALPGDLVPTKALTGKKINEGFYEVKTAQLSGEVIPFSEKVQEAGQVVSGAMPQIFGGAAENTSKTASQYSMMRSQSLQRLQTPWKMLTIWWKDIFGKVIPAFMECMREDERFVERDTDGNYLNVFIRMAEITGKIGSIELEAAENFPLTWQQKKDTVIAIMQSGNQELMAALSAPENMPLLKEMVGLSEFKIPGEDDRQKQYAEIQQLLQTQPIFDPMTGQEAPSIDIEPQVDNNMIHADIVKRWAVSPQGRLAKVENPLGYKNVLLHGARHIFVMNQLMMQQQMNNTMVNPGGAAPEEKPNEQDHTNDPSRITQ